VIDSSKSIARSISSTGLRSRLFAVPRLAADVIPSWGRVSEILFAIKILSEWEIEFRVECSWRIILADYKCFLQICAKPNRMSGLG
jgi:hypothetical protein